MLLYHTIVLCLTIATAITIIYTTATAVTSISTTTTIIGMIVNVVHMVGGGGRRRYGIVVSMTTEYGGMGVTYDTLRLTIGS